MAITTSTGTSWVHRLPWYRKVSGWGPFKIDALGLVTFLGAEEINSSIGRLVPSRYLEYFPLLGAYVVANEGFKQKKTSFHLYNITDGIQTTDATFWLTRWMFEQEFEQSRSIVRFEIAEKPRSWLKWHIVSAALSFAFTSLLIAFTILIGDWYGFANGLAMFISVGVRAYSMQTHRNAIDKAVEEAVKRSNGQAPVDKKCIMVLSDSKAVTVWLPGNLIVTVFTYNPEPQNPWLYHLVRYLGWAVFGVHIISIGQATLAAQLYTVGLLVIPTVLICWKLGCDDSKWRPKFDSRVLRHPKVPYEYECWFGTRLKASVTEYPVDMEFEFVEAEGKWIRQSTDAAIEPHKRSKRRQDLYAWLNLTEDEEESMGKWDLLPHVRKGDKSWWNTYLAKKDLIRLNPLDSTRGRTDTMNSSSTGIASPVINGVARSDTGQTEKSTAAAHVTAMDDDQSDPAFRRPARSNTWLTANGFVANQSQSADPARQP